MASESPPKPHASSRRHAQPSMRGREWLHDNSPMLHVRLTRDESEQLRQRAASIGLKPWDLVRQWVLAQLERPPSGGEVASGHPAATFLAEPHFASVDSRLERLERAVSLMSSVLNLEMRARPSRDTVPVGNLAAESNNTSPRLHDEILAVLREEGRAMTSEKIAEAISRRGRYRPRSGHSVSAAAISGRIANPRYRPLFRREGRFVSPGEGV